MSIALVMVSISANSVRSILAERKQVTMDTEMNARNEWETNKKSNEKEKKESMSNENNNAILPFNI